jgi:hypothetical protein
MPEEAKFSGGEASLVLHATEDEDKVLQSVEKVLSIPSRLFLGTHMEGHYKNRIIVMKALIPSQVASKLAVQIISMLNSVDRDELRRNINRYSDEKGNLYLRLDKQLLCQGKVGLSTSDSLRLRFKPVKRYKPSSNVESFRGLISSTG